jgi:hypothetical protein
MTGQVCRPSGFGQACRLRANGMPPTITAGQPATAVFRLALRPRYACCNEGRIRLPCRTSVPRVQASTRSRIPIRSRYRCSSSYLAVGCQSDAGDSAASVPRTAPARLGTRLAPAAPSCFKQAGGRRPAHRLFVSPSYLNTGLAWEAWFRLDRAAFRFGQECPKTLFYAVGRL